MINTFIISTLIFIYIVYLRNKFDLSLVLLYVFSMIGPNLHIFNLYIPISIILFLVMFFRLIIYEDNVIKNIKLKKQSIILIFIFIYICSDFIINNILENNSRVEYITLFAYFRFIVLYILINNYPHIKIDNFLFPVIFVNVLIIFYQMIYPEEVNAFYQLYGKPSYDVIKRSLEAGYFSRPVGTLLSPVVLGVFSLLSFTYYLTTQSQIYNKNIKLFLSCFIGIAALSKTAIIGIPIILLINTIRNGVDIYKVRRFCISIALLILFIFVYIMIFPEKLEVVLWYFRYLYNPFGALTTRYSSSGNVSLMFDSITNHFIFGAGTTFVDGIIFNDSMYAVLLIEGGVVFFLLYVAFLLLTLKNIEMFIAIMLAGLAANFSFSLLLLPFVFKENSDKKEVII